MFLVKVFEIEILANKKLFSDAISGKTYPWDSNVNTSIDNYIYTYYRDRNLYHWYDTLYSDVSTLLTTLKTDIATLFDSRKYTWGKLYETTLLEYNPIENYSMTERENATMEATSVQGAQTNTDTNDYGPISVAKSEILGAQTNTETATMGEQAKLTTMNIGEQVTEGSTINETAPYSSEGYQSDTKSIDSVTSGAKSDSTQEHNDAYTNTNEQTFGAKDNTYTTTTDGRKDILKKEIGGKTDSNNSTNNRELTRSGNIGVTTSQQMLESERQVAMFNFVQIVAHEVVRLISSDMYDSI